MLINPITIYYRSLIQRQAAAGIDGKMGFAVKMQDTEYKGGGAGIQENYLSGVFDSTPDPKKEQLLLSKPAKKANNEGRDGRNKGHENQYLVSNSVSDVYSINDAERNKYPRGSDLEDQGIPKVDFARHSFDDSEKEHLLGKKAPGESGLARIHSDAEGKIITHDVREDVSYPQSIWLSWGRGRCASDRGRDAKAERASKGLH
jgi:hypothetical protein